MSISPAEELRIIREKIEEKKMDPRNCVMQDFPEIDTPSSLSGPYLHLPGPVSRVFRQRVVISIAFPHVRVLYAFCKKFRTPPELSGEILSLILQVNSELSDCVVIFKPSKLNTVHLKLAYFIDSSLSEKTFASLFWRELTTVTDTFKKKLSELARFLARFEQPLLLYPQKTLARLSPDELRAISSARSSLETKARDEMTTERFPDNVPVYRLKAYVEGCGMGLVSILISVFEAYKRLLLKGVKLKDVLTGFVVSEGFDRQVVLVPCEFETVQPRSVVCEEVFLFLRQDICASTLPSKRLVRIFALSKVVFLRDLQIRVRKKESMREGESERVFESTSLSAGRTHRLIRLFSALESLRTLTANYFIWTKVLPRLASKDVLSEGIVLCPACISSASWESLSEKDQVTLQASVWTLVDPNFVPLSELTLDLGARIALVQLILPNLISQLSRCHSIGIAHLHISPSSILVTPGGDVFLSNISLFPNREPMGGAATMLRLAPLIAEDLPFTAPEVVEGQELDADQLIAADVFSVGMTLHATLFPDEVPHYGSVRAYQQQFCEELRRPFVPNDFEREHPEFTDVLRRSWEDKYRPALSEFQWKGRGSILKRKAAEPLRPQCSKKAKRKVYKVVPGAYLGVWKYSKNASGFIDRMYVSRRGEVLSGVEAVSAYKLDKRGTQQEVHSPETPEHWGVPAGLAHRLRQKGLAKLFQWQVDCLNRPAVLGARKSLVFCAPTSGGKSLVAEILLLRSVLVHKKRALYVLPYISIVQEKLTYLQQWLFPVLKVEAFCSDRDKFWHPFIDIGVCTIEKAYGIVNKLIEENNGDRLGCIVVDELHMLGEGERGGLLESLLLKARHLKWQIVGMSATLPKAEELAEWLEADFFRAHFRPVPLERYLVEGGCVKDAHLQVVRALPSGDPTVNLALEAQDLQTIMFCASKAQCESLCRTLAAKMPASTSPLCAQLKHELTRTPDFSPALTFGMSHCTAFHHADLSSAERALVEKYYRAGLVKVLCATSTLAAGVNLPAARVVITSPYMGTQPLSCRNYQQMSGRAGRSEASGRVGESYLIAKKPQDRECRRLLSGDAEPVQSCLMGEALKRTLIDGLATGLIKSEEDLKTYLSLSFRARTHFAELLAEAQSQLAQLRDSQLLVDFTATPVLKATFASMLAPQVGIALKSELLEFGAHVFSTSEFFWLYLVTPRDCKSVTWRSVGKAFQQLREDERRVVSALRLDAEKVLRWEFLGVDKNDNVEPYYRLVAAVALRDRLSGSSIREVADRLDLSAGIVQSWEVQSEALCGMMGVYCQRLSLWMYSSSFSSLQGRLSRVSSESLLQPLLSLPGVKPSRAKALFAAGIHDPAAILATDSARLEDVIRRAESTFRRSYDAEKERAASREVVNQLKKEAKEWAERGGSPETEAHEESCSEEECEASEDLRPVLDALGAYIDSGLETDEYVALLQESVSSTTL